jgi:hypothetical protein
MAWYTGKTAIAGACIGDSNALGSGGFGTGGQSWNRNIRVYASLDGDTPYSESNLDWRDLDPNGTERSDEYTSAITTGDETYVGQLLGGNGNSAMQAASVIQVQTGIDNYLYQSAVGGTTAFDWANEAYWDCLLRTIPGSLASIPGAPTAFDYLIISLNGNDLIQGYTYDQFYTYVNQLRTQMIGEGWWVPGVTQVVTLDMPRVGFWPEYAADWPGWDGPLRRFNDRIAGTNSTGLAIDDAFPVHFAPASYTALGQQAGEKIVAQVPTQRSVFSVSGNRLSVGGQKLRVHSA